MGSHTADAQFGKLLKDVKKEVDKVTGSGLSEDQIGSGLKEALHAGVDQAVDQLSLDKGYLESPYKILIPEEAQTIISKVKIIPGFENVERDLILKMNQAAERAATKAGLVFSRCLRVADGRR